ncbi:Zn 2cys6 transcription factor [Colletotrichum higginsianum IMI 349063]|uniref:Zn 2cys6 transcription factor n=1 Tax=Colletotrichum higginsianum (strain IMI 349063) TaxID=759273 RepID=A0A1B7YSD4_COLHI|nr:Zn 2cys6 transcription factor [Colletotrichum higginsianum IMI 349063]OBR14946.1 Zn 2cys6 transcription factor [Colletotrichum higginsianum IMI 349063]
MDSDRRKSRRTTNACVSCRQSKIKCSGDEPCSNCRRRVVKCKYSDGNNKEISAESHSRSANHERPRRHSEQHPSSGSKRSHDVALGSDDEDSDFRPGDPRSSEVGESPECVYTSPFTLPSTTIKNTHHNKRNWIWLAPSSTWSFTARLTLMMAERLQLDTPFSAPSFLNDEIYVLKWRASTADEQPDISGLPSYDHALYLFNTVKFHLGQNYQLIDEKAFTKDLEEFYYGIASKKAAESRLWFVQFLLVLSFGQAFLSRSKTPKEPPGSKFFVRAMSLLPEPTSLWKDSLLAIEVLSLSGLYLYSIYQRESAQLYAIRIAQLEGLHTQLPEDTLGAETVTRCRNLWWTLYIMDRHFSCSVGVPMNTQDTDITTLLQPPSTCSQRDATLGLQVKLSYLLSKIITTVYKSEKTPLGEFLGATKSILHTLAGHAQEIQKITRSKYQNSVDTMPKGTRGVTLLYHQGRPWRFNKPLDPFEKLGFDGYQVRGEDAPNIIRLVHIQQAHSILDEMIQKGNSVAEVRKAELVHLEWLFEQFATRVGQQDFQRRRLSASIEAIMDPAVINVAVTEPDLVSMTTLSESQALISPFPDTPDNTEFLQSIGISSEDFLSIAEQMDSQSQDGFPYSTMDLGQFWK